MKKNKNMKFIKILSLVIVLGSCGPVVKKNIEATTYDYPLKSIAILPFSVFADTNRLRTGITPENIARAAEMGRYRFQRHLYASFLKKPRKNKLWFQNFMETNKLLKKAGLYEDFSEKIKSQLCALLGVDAVIYGQMNIFKPMYQDNARIINGIVGLGVAASNKMELELRIYDANNNLRWKKMYKIRGDVGDDKMVEVLLSKVPKSFPF